MVLANPPLAEPVTDPGGVINKPPFEMGVANFVSKENGAAALTGGDKSGAEMGKYGKSSENGGYC